MKKDELFQIWPWCSSSSYYYIYRQSKNHITQIKEFLLKLQQPHETVCCAIKHCTKLPSITENKIYELNQIHSRLLLVSFSFAKQFKIKRLTSVPLLVTHKSFCSVTSSPNSGIHPKESIQGHIFAAAISS